MPEVEFVVEDGNDPASGEQNSDDVFARLQVPRWAWYTGALAIAALVLGTIVRHHDPQRSLAAPRPIPHLVSLPPLPAGRSPAADAGAAAPDDVAASAIGTWVLQRGRLQAIRGTRVIRTVRVPGLDTATSRGTPRVVVDPTAHRVWVVDEVAVHSRLIEFDARTMRPLRILWWVKTVRSAAALDGHLYVSTDLGVYNLGPGASRPHAVPGLLPAVGRLATDPTRDRVIAIDYGFPTNAWTIRPGHRPVESTTTLPFGSGTLVVAGSRIWVGGAANAGTVVQRLAPATLRPELTRHGVSLVGAGIHSVWIRTGHTLACADAASGRVQQRWQLPAFGSVASGPDGAIVTTRDGSVALLLEHCRG